MHSTLMCKLLYNTMYYSMQLLVSVDAENVIAVCMYNYHICVRMCVVALYNNV